MPPAPGGRLAVSGISLGSLLASNAKETVLTRISFSPSPKRLRSCRLSAAVRDTVVAADLVRAIARL